MEEADRVALELLLRRLVTLGLRQAADPVTSQAPMQGRPRQVRDRRLQRIKAIVERQQRMPAEGGNDCLLFDSTVEAGFFGPVGISATEVRFFHFDTVFWLMP